MQTDAMDTIGTSGNDDLFIDQQIPYFYALEGNDSLEGDVSGQLLHGNQGNDTIYAEEGNDTVYGGQDNDNVNGGAGNDVVSGNKGADTVYGNEGSDTLFGGRGADFLAGGEGNDILSGDLGMDQLNGGLGADIFVFSDAANPDASVTVEMEFIQDFNRAEGDKIGLAGDLEFGDLVISNPGVARIDYTANGIEHTIFLTGNNILLQESDFVYI